MSDKEKEKENLDSQEQESGQSSAETKNTEDHMIPKARFDEINERLKAAEKRANAAEKAAQKAQEEKLKEQNDYKALYEQTLEQLNKIKPLADKTGVYQETLDTVLNAQINEIPEDMRSLIPDELSTDQKLAWISRNKTLLTKPVGPDIGAGVRGSGNGSQAKPLEGDEKATAKSFGMSDEEYTKYNENEPVSFDWETKE